MRLFLLFSVCINLLPNYLFLENQEKPKENLILDFDFHSLEEFKQKYKFVLTFFNDVQTRRGKKNQKKFVKIANKMNTTEILFLQVQTNHLTEEEASQIQDQFPSKLNFYIYGFKKSFHQRFKQNVFIDWVTHIYTAHVEKFQSLQKLLEEINFVYIEQKWLKENETHLEILSKLIFPIKIISQIPENVLDQFKNSKNEPFWIFQSYSSKIIPIDINLDIKKKAQFIQENEFPNFMVSDENNYKILFYLKIPSAIYYTKNSKKDKNINLIKRIAQKYKEYFLLTIVDTSKKNFETRFLKKFLHVKKQPALRILNMTGKVQRFKFHGKLKENLIDNFFNNYVHENLKPFKLNQNIQYEEKKYNILKANHKMFQRMLKDEDITYVIFVYGQKNQDLISQLEELDLVQNVLRKNKTLKFYCIDHDQNDLDGYYNDQLPFLFIANRLGKLDHYEGKLEADKILSFINSKLPYLENSEPTFQFVDDEL